MCLLGIHEEVNSFLLIFSQLKARLRQQQIELQAEQENSSIMLKEMQQLLSAERLEKEELKIRLQEVIKSLHA